MTRRDEAVSSYFFLFVMVWFFYFFSCVSQPFFSSHQHRACNQLYSSHRYVRLFLFFSTLRLPAM